MREIGEMLAAPTCNEHIIAACAIDGSSARPPESTPAQRPALIPATGTARAGRSLSDGLRMPQAHSFGVLSGNADSCSSGAGRRWAKAVCRKIGAGRHVASPVRMSCCCRVRRSKSARRQQLTIVPVHWVLGMCCWISCLSLPGLLSPPPGGCALSLLAVVSGRVKSRALRHDPAR